MPSRTTKLKKRNFLSHFADRQARQPYPCANLRTQRQADWEPESGSVCLMPFDPANRAVPAHCLHSCVEIHYMLLAKLTGDGYSFAFDRRLSACGCVVRFQKHQKRQLSGARLVVSHPGGKGRATIRWRVHGWEHEQAQQRATPARETESSQAMLSEHSQLG